MAKSKRERRYGKEGQNTRPSQENTQTAQTAAAPSRGLVTYEEVQKKYRFYFNIVAKRKIWFAISLILLVLSVGSLALQGLNYGIEYTGGSLISVVFDQPTTQEAVNEALTTAGLQGQVQLSDETTALIRTTELTTEQRDALITALETQAGTFDRQNLQENIVDGAIGAELQVSALQALLVASALMLAYIAFRFKVNYAVSGVLALLHDVIITVGIFSLIRWQIDAAFIAAVLTIFGYSINDKVVIFDRIRENEKLLKKKGSFEDMVDQSIWQTMSRSINTGVTVLLALLAIFFLGGETTKTFALAMTLGVVVGMYSSICIASQLVITMKNLGKKETAEG